MIATLEQTPPNATHWSRASMAARTGLSRSTIGRIWRQFELKPHVQDLFKLSTDPLFVDKVVDVVGLYHHPPERAVVLCVDEKSGIQALDRSQPVLPMMPGMPERRTHDYVRHGTTSLFAAFNIADGSVISAAAPPAPGGRVPQVPRRASTRPSPPSWTSTWSATTTPPTRPRRSSDWLARHPRFHLHFTPTGSSWINQVERWFGLLTDQLIRRGVHTSVVALENDIRAMDQELERGPETVHLDQDRRGNPPIPSEIYREDLRRRTLVSPTEIRHLSRRPSRTSAALLVRPSTPGTRLGPAPCRRTPGSADIRNGFPAEDTS